MTALIENITTKQTARTTMDTLQTTMSITHSTGDAKHPMVSTYRSTNGRIVSCEARDGGHAAGVDRVRVGRHLDRSE